jgi:ketosteroid isomerase-like protein
MHSREEDAVTARRGEIMRRTVLLGSAALLAGLMAKIGRSHAQQSPETEHVKTANSAFYTALSARDIKATERLWVRDEQVFTIFGASRSPLVGWSALNNGYVELFNRFPELSVTMPEPSIRQDGDFALVVGVEALRARLQNGEILNLSLPTTNVFVNRNGQWLLIQHHSSRPPV